MPSDDACIDNHCPECGEYEAECFCYEDDFEWDRPCCPECDACILEGDAHDSECPYA